MTTPVNDAPELRGANATYSPDDNKLRLYPVSRLDAETYARVKAAGFKFAPRQELFVAPMWTPEREDLLVALCGEIGDEDTSLVDRAEERAERFEEYREKRMRDAESAHAAVKSIADNIPFGQPILVGHHSEKHARKDAERIENGMRKAVKMWKTSKYWTDRAEGAIAHAAYKERPDVRARRIKKLEADKRKIEKNVAHSATRIRLWEKVTDLELAKKVANYGGGYDVCSKLDRNEITWEVAREKSMVNHARYIEHAKRWIEHYDNRLAYERAMLGESGYIEPPKRPTRAVLPILNYSGTVEYRNPYHGNTVTAEAVGMTSAEYAKINKDYKGTRISADGSHRIRSAMVRHDLVMVWLTDKKQHPRPGAGGSSHEQLKVDQKVGDAKRKLEAQLARRREVVEHNRELINRTDDKPELSNTLTSENPDVTSLQAIEQQLRDAKRENRPVITVAVAPTLFVTPPEIARKMAEELGDLDGKRVLEPSAGTGNLAVAVLEAGGRDVLCCEIDYRLAKALRGYGYDTINADFLERPAVPEFDAVIMNPPFNDGADIKHVKHAFTMLKPGGRLVALCANGPRQQRNLGALVEEHGGTWEDLPEGSFKDAGTNVRVALLVVDAPTRVEPGAP